MYTRQKRLFIVTFLSAFYLLFLIIISDAWADNNDAVILVGDVDGLYNPCAARNTANEAASDLKKAGYDTRVNYNATKQDAINAIGDSKTRAIVIIAHGDGKKSQYEEGVLMSDADWLDSDAFGGRTFPNVQEVIIHGCGQDKPSWKYLFPNAKFYSWSRSVRMYSIYWWQWFHTSAAIHPMPITDDSLSSLSSYTVGGRSLAPFGTEMDPWFQMDPQLTMDFGFQTMNLFGTNDNGLNKVLLAGLTIQSGHVIDYNYDGYLSSYFDITLPESVMFSALEYPTSIVDAYRNGLVGISINQSTGASEQTLFDGSAAVIFGVNATVIPEPSTIVLLGSGLAGIVGFGRKRLLGKRKNV